MKSFFPILAEKRDAKGSALSGGQQQMLAIARGLMAKPKILILDEPSLGLAPIIVHEVRSIILSVRNRFGAAVLLVEQNAALALAVADRGYIMQNGRIVAAGAIEELRSLDWCGRRISATVRVGRVHRPARQDPHHDSHAHTRPLPTYRCPGRPDQDAWTRA